jgi:C-terminal processing protease CtpA/Prc
LAIQKQNSPARAKAWLWFTLAGFTDKKWCNIKDGIVSFKQKFITNKLVFEKPIAIIIGKHTISSGEFITGIFYGRSNVKIFGHKTGGYFSSNNTIELNDDLIFNFTSSLCTTVDGTPICLAIG